MSPEHSRAERSRAAVAVWTDRGSKREVKGAKGAEKKGESCRPDLVFCLTISIFFNLWISSTWYKHS